MRDLQGTPPRIGGALSLSAVLSAASLVLYLRDVPRGERSNWISVDALLTTTFDVYYLFRYVQGRSLIKRGISAGGNAWPAAHLFPGPAEHVNHTSLAILAALLHALTLRYYFSAQSMGATIDIWDPPAVVLTSCLGLITSIIVAMQAVYARTAEDKLSCEQQGHDMRCERCGALKSNLNVQPILPSRPIHPLPALNISVIFSTLFVYSIGKLVTPISLQASVCFAIIPALGTIHRAYYILRIAYVNRGPSIPAWPFTRFIPGKREKYMFWVGNMVLVDFYVVGAFFALHTPLRELWHRGYLEKAMCGYAAALLFIETTVFINDLIVTNAENAASCMRTNHHWRCSRACSTGLMAVGGATDETGSTTKVLINSGEGQLLGTALP